MIVNNRIDQFMILYYNRDNKLEGICVKDATKYGIKVDLKEKTLSWKNIKKMPFGVRNDIAMTNHRGPIGICDLDTIEGRNEMIRIINEAIMWKNY